MAAVRWIDFSRKGRNRVNSILNLLQPEGQVNELGVDTIGYLPLKKEFVNLKQLPSSFKIHLIYSSNNLLANSNLF